jgi:AraC-like DNA-binding protein
MPIRSLLQSDSIAPTVSVRVAQSLIRAAAAVGVSQDELLRSAGMPLEEVFASEGRMPRSSVFQLCQHALTLSKDPALGLRWGNLHAANAFEIVSELVRHAPTLRQGLEALSKFSRLITDRAGFEIVERGEHVYMTSTLPTAVPLSARRCASEMLVVGFVNLVCAVDVNVRPLRVCFDYPAPDYRDEYAREFHGAEEFEQTFSGVVFDRAVMDVPSPYRDTELQAVLRSVAEGRLLRLTESTPFSARACDLILKRAVHERTDMRSVARLLGMSGRSLRRRLHAEGTSWDEIAKRVASSKAKQILTTSQLTIQQVAFALGFQSASAFHRAFKRWTGMTPLAYRQAHVEGREQVDSLGLRFRLTS